MRNLSVLTVAITAAALGVVTAAHARRPSSASAPIALDGEDDGGDDAFLRRKMVVRHTCEANDDDSLHRTCVVSGTYPTCAVGEWFLKDDDCCTRDETRGHLWHSIGYTVLSCE